MTTEDFAEYYTSISDLELLAILGTPYHYQDIAIEAAKKELARRQLSEDQIEKVRIELFKNQKSEAKEKEKIKTIETKIKTAGKTIIDTLTPIQGEVPSTEKKINRIAIIFGLLSVLQVVINLKMLGYFVDDIPRFPFTSSVILFPFIILPIASILFWKRVSAGWTMLIIFLTFSTISVLWMLLLSTFHSQSDLDGFGALFPTTSTLTYLIQLTFLIGALYIVCKADIRKVFSITENKAFARIGLTGVFAFFVMYAIS